jgi:hypothetical protein
MFVLKHTLRDAYHSSPQFSNKRLIGGTLAKKLSRTTYEKTDWIFKSNLFLANSYAAPKKFACR